MILLMPGNWKPSAAHLDALGGMVGRARVVHAVQEQDALDAMADAEIVVGHRFLRQALPFAERLAWVQSSAAGVDHLPIEQLRQRRVLLTRNPVNSEAIALHVLALMLALVRRLPEAFESQRQSRWAAPFAMRELPRQVLVLGLGGIGQALGVRLRALGIRVLGCARANSDEQRRACDEFVPAAAWREVLGRVDAVVFALPLTDETRGMLGATEIDCLPSGALVINVARAGLLDMAALRAALRSGKLGGAALDVLDPVPEPGDPLWHEPGLIVTPKVAAYHPGMQRDFERFVELQMMKYLRGEPLDAVVRL